MQNLTLSCFRKIFPSCLCSLLQTTPPVWLARPLDIGYMGFYGFSGGSVVKTPPAKAGDVGLIPALGRFHWRRIWQPTPVFLPGKSQGQRSLEDYGPWGHKEPNTTQWPNKTTTATSAVLKVSCFHDFSRRWIYAVVHVKDPWPVTVSSYSFSPFCSRTEYTQHPYSSMMWGNSVYSQSWCHGNVEKLWLLAMKEYGNYVHNTNITFVEV